MHWITQLLGNTPQLTTLQKQRLATWQKLPSVPLDTPMNKLRCVVMDVETTGLNLMHDRLISIGAVAIVNQKITLGDSFYIVLQQATVSKKENILLHGISSTAQLEGEPPVDALLSFLEYLGKSPLIAFHVTFDETMTRRSIQEYLGFSLKHSWLDLAYVMPGLNPLLSKKYQARDDWLGHFGIPIDVRHNAFADALATAQLFQIAFVQGRKKSITNLAGLHDLEKAQRWVNTVS